MVKQRFVLPVDPDPCPDLMIERGPKGTGVGRWVPDDKHTLLAKWLGGTRQARVAYGGHGRLRGRDSGERGLARPTASAGASSRDSGVSGTS